MGEGDRGEGHWDWQLSSHQQRIQTCELIFVPCTFSTISLLKYNQSDWASLKNFEYPTGYSLMTSKSCSPAQISPMNFRTINSTWASQILLPNLALWSSPPILAFLPSSCVSCHSEWSFLHPVLPGRKSEATLGTIFSFSHPHISQSLTTSWVFSLLIIIRSLHFSQIPWPPTYKPKRHIFLRELAPQETSGPALISSPQFPEWSSQNPKFHV